MISIITPFHKPIQKQIYEAYASLRNQTVQDWEWVLMPNGGARVEEKLIGDRRIKVKRTIEDGRGNRIGRLKRECCEASQGDILVELDGDDLLMPTCLEDVLTAFGDPKIQLVYSNSADFDDHWVSTHYSNYYGWRWRDFNYEGHNLYEMIAWEPSPHMMRYVFWAPNHVRAWRKSAYLEVGGHNREMANGDDHELCCRFFVKYGSSGFKHLDKCLYLYRRHSENSCAVWNADIQKRTDENYCKFSRSMAIRWAQDEGLRLLDLGGRLDPWTEFETVDLMGADILWDLENDWPFDDDSVGVIRASHIFEHLRDPIHTMNEAFRVLTPGGWLFIDVPSTDGRGAFQDPTHKSFWNINSFWYYTHRNQARYIRPTYKGRFQVSRMVDYFPNDWFRNNNIPITQADLICLKPPYSDRPVGAVDID